MATTITWGNPYTHEEHSRTTYTAKDFLYGSSEKVRRHGATCDWCGQVRGRVYAYDGGSKVFCNRNCYQDYYL